MAVPDRTQPDGAAPVVISEFVASNSGVLLDEDGDPSDWIELWNRSGAPVPLRDWSLTNDPTRPAMWPFRDVVLEPDQRLLVFASGKDRRRLEPESETVRVGFLHTNFKLAAEQGFLALFPPTSRRYLDGSAFHYPPQHPDQSYGLSADGLPAFFDNVTPAERNGRPIALAPLAPIGFSHQRGFYGSPFELELWTASADAAIYFTLDGSAPGVEQGRLYDEPISIERTTIVRAVAAKPGHMPSAPITHSFLFPADVVQQPAAPHDAAIDLGRSPNRFRRLRGR